MSDEYATWKAKLKANNKGGESIKSIDRGTSYTETLAFEGDVTSSTFRGEINSSTDPQQPALAQFTVTVGNFDGTETPVTLTLTKAQVDALPADGDNDGVVTLLWDILQTVGGEEQRIAGGSIDILGRVTKDVA